MCQLLDQQVKGSQGGKVPTIGIPPQCCWRDAGLHSPQCPVVPSKLVWPQGAGAVRGVSLSACCTAR